MKTSFVCLLNFALILSTMFLSSCSEETNQIQKLTGYEPVDSQIPMLVAMGFREDMIEDKGEHYLIEGDILFSKKGLPRNLYKEQQWATDYLVSKSQAQDIVVKIDASIPTSGVDSWRPEIADALAEWNNLVGCLVNFRIDNSSNSPDITVYGVDHNYFGSYSIQAEAEFPTSDGRPGYRVLISLDFNDNESVPSGRKKYNFAHEIGHCIGFRHTNWSLRGESSSGANLIPATPNTDDSSIMNGGTAMYYWNGFSTYDIRASIALYTDGDWYLKPGALKQVSVGDQNNIWGINSDDQIYRWNGSDWTNITPGGRLNQISAASDGTVWGTNTAGQIYRWDGIDWINVTPGARLRQVSVGSATIIWGTNLEGQIYRWNGSDWTNVTPGARLEQVSVASDGTVYGVNSTNQIYRWNGNDWAAVPGALFQISVGSANTIWGVNSQDQIFKWSGSDWQNITYTGRLRNVSVGSDGTVWGVNSSYLIYKGTFYLESPPKIAQQ